LTVVPWLLGVDQGLLDLFAAASWPSGHENLVAGTVQRRIDGTRRATPIPTVEAVPALARPDVQRGPRGVCDHVDTTPPPEGAAGYNHAAETVPLERQFLRGSDRHSGV